MHRSFEVTVLGTSSASPTKTRHPSGQLVRLEGDYFLIDCGEGTQLQLVKLGLRMHRIKYILISHMHGDHFYGLPGLISSMALFGRNEKLTIAGPEPLQGLLENIFQITESRVPFEIEYLVTNPAIPQQILANSKWAIKTVPLQHRIACTGFVIEERGPELRLNVSVCEAMGVPVKQYENIKWGGDWIKDDGSIVSNKLLTLPGNPNRSYAYISDTIYDESLIQHIEGASLLYHEATFMHDLLRRAQETHHSTAKQAGQMAALTKAGKLLIGHFSGRYSHTDDLLQEARESFSEAYVAEEGRTYQL